jgi:hypothetical protein
MKTELQASQSILMVHPADFEFNTETAADNEFQHNPQGISVREKALEEFSNAVEILRSEGVEVLVLEKDNQLPPMPDAVFPNNWFATDSDGKIHLFPMKTPNRQAEVRQVDGAIRLLENAGYRQNGITDWRNVLGEGAVLEGTGSLILDRANRRFFAAISERTQEAACRKFAEKSGMMPVLFHTRSSAGFAYYHTNVVMSIGPGIIVACLDCIQDDSEKATVRAEILRYHKLLEISISQLEKGFCGNLLQVLNRQGEVLTVLSKTAFDSLDEEQRKILSGFGKLIPISIPVIEQVGGGSIRCMMAEIFCPRNPV